MLVAALPVLGGAEGPRSKEETGEDPNPWCHGWFLGRFRAQNLSNGLSSRYQKDGRKL
jgi:hypothetical protein